MSAPFDSRVALTAPPIIWLQVDANGTDHDQLFPQGHSGEVTWCMDSVGGVEVEYIRARAPVAWMRRWAAEGVNVMALPKDKRPPGWGLLPITPHKLVVDDVPLIFGTKQATPPYPG